jgi:hypothetical protein
MKTTITRLLAILIAISSVGCKLFIDPPMDPPEAEIQEIKYYSDTAVFVTINVYSNSNASSCGFGITATAVDGTDKSSLGLSRECDLKDRYIVVLGGLGESDSYSFQLHASGEYDVWGDKDERHDFLVGEPRIFTFP